MSREIPASTGSQSSQSLSPGDLYQRAASAHESEEKDLARRSRTLSNLRLGFFIVGAGALFATLFNAEASDAPLFWIALAGVVAFIIAVRLHDRVIRRQRRAAGLVRLNREGPARQARRWDEIPLPLAPPELTARPVSRDLNLFGRASLFHLLGTVATPPGRETLAGWLTSPAAPAEIRRRQEAVAELAAANEEALDHRQRIQLAAAEMAQLGKAAPFLEWAEGSPWLLARPALLWGSRVLTALSLGLLAATFLGLVSWSIWALVAVANLGLDYLCAKSVYPILDRVEAREVGFRQYAQVLALIDEAPWRSELLEELVAETRAGGLSAHRAMDRLGRWVTLADARHSGLVHAALSALLLWDFHVLAGIERWQVRHGRHTRRWLEGLGQIEAICALGTLCFEHPDWSFPELVPSSPSADRRLTAEGLGHPLLPPEARVDNDVELGPPGTFLLVTGSNMSGKSTLLRAIGTNVALAQAGGPACARHLRLPPLALGTSLLIEDSLTSGVSFFLAELQRLKAIVDRADSLRAEGRDEPGEPGRTLLFLLDEVLRGTNSAERRIAIERVLGHLMEAGAIGAVTTHDLALAEAESIREAARPVHLRETLHPAGDGPPMSFDYQLRPGLATTTNALTLLALVGLDDAPTHPDPHDGSGKIRRGGRLKVD